MGEWSRTIGEIGEGIVAQLLTLMGWSDAQSNVTIPCRLGEKHKTSDGVRRTHGIDRLLTYSCPLIDGLRQNLIISAKYSAKAYNKNPVSTFKGHFSDLANTIDCFKGSEERQRAFKALSGIRMRDDAGVLFWLNNNSKDDEFSILPKLAPAEVSDALTFGTIYIIDNHQAAFLYDAISAVKRRTSGTRYSFFYPDTGQNTNSQTRALSGTILPVQHSVSSVLPFRIQDEESGRTNLVLCANETFSEGSFQRLVALAQTLSLNWATKIDIGFSRFDEALNSNDVQRVKALFADKTFTASISVFTFRADFRTPQESQ